MARLSTSICLDDHTKTPALLVSTEDRTRLHDLFRTFRRLGRLLVPSEEVYEDAGGAKAFLAIDHADNTTVLGF